MGKGDVVEFVPSPKQGMIWHYFRDKETTAVLFGGSVNCGKSYALCAFLIWACLEYPGTTWLLGRCELKNLKATTLVSFWEVCENFKLVRDVHFTYNEQKSEIEFTKGSKIFLRDVTFFASDPDCINLNGLLLTGACIDEAGEPGITKKVYDIVQSRCGRWKNDQYNIKQFLLMTCNPSKNFLYDEFYKPAKNNSLPPHQKFITALMEDNPKAQSGYRDHVMRTLSERDIQRLVKGNWEYENVPDGLITYENIISLWDQEPKYTGQKYISADIALEGSDKLVFIVWDGLCIEKIIAVDKSDGKEVTELLGELIRVYRVDERNVVYDFDGLGSFIKGWFPSAKPIRNGSPAKLGENYFNLKSQLYFKLAEYINQGKISMLEQKFKPEIVQELEQVRKKDNDLDRKVAIVSKAEVKQAIGRSPDFTDAMAYRMLFELKSASSGKYHYLIDNGEERW